MAITFPTSLDSFTNPLGTDYLNVLSHAEQHSNVNDAVEALEAKVGVTSSAVTSSLDYLLKNALSIDPGHHHTVANGIATGLQTHTGALQLTANVTSDVTLKVTGMAAQTGRYFDIQTTAGDHPFYVQPPSLTYPDQVFINGRVNIYAKVGAGYAFAAYGEDTTSAAFCFKALDVAATQVFGCRNNGAVSIGSQNSDYCKLFTFQNAAAAANYPGSGNAAIEIGSALAGQYESLFFAYGGKGAASRHGWRHAVLGVNLTYDVTADAYQRTTSPSASWISGMGIVMGSSASFTAGNVARMSFLVTNAAATDATEALCITSSGRIGMFTTNPAKEIELQNNTIIGAAASTVGFFGNAGIAKQTQASPSAIVTTDTAGATYTSAEQTMLAHLKTDVTNLRSTLDTLITNLKNHNLFT
jgi:hypothetical protein